MILINKLAINDIVKSLLNSVGTKKSEPELRYSSEFFETIWFIIAENSFCVGAINSSQILEYFRKYKDQIQKYLNIAKPSLCELMFRWSLIELQNNVNKGRETDIIFDRLRLFKLLVIDTDANNFVNDMRFRVYSNINWIMCLYLLCLYNFSITFK